MQAILAEVAGERNVGDLFRHGALLEPGRVEIGDRSRRRRAAEDIVGNAVRVAIVGHRAANGRAARPADHVERIAQTGGRELVLVDLGIVGPTVLIIAVVGPGATEIAAAADQPAEGGVLQIGDPRTAFDVTTQQLEERLVVGRSSPRVEEVDRRRARRRVVASERGGREGPDEAVDQIARSADLRPLRRRHQRVVAVDRIGVAEVARRRDLRQRAVVHEHEFHVRLDRWRHLIVGEHARGVALVRTLEIVQRREVEAGQRPLGQRSRPERANSGGRWCACQIREVESIASRRRRRTAALERSVRVETTRIL